MRTNGQRLEIEQVTPRQIAQWAHAEALGQITDMIERANKIAKFAGQPPVFLNEVEPTKRTYKKRRARMSAANRAEISARMIKYWAGKRRKAGKNGKA